MTHFKSTVIVTSLLAIFLSTEAFAEGARVHRQNAAGGATNAVAHKFQGEKGGTFVNGRRVVTDGAGNATGVSGGAATTANGGQYKRKAQFNRAADGSASRQGSVEASGQNGSLTSAGSATKNSDGTVNASRESEITNAKTDITKNNSATYNTEQGLTRSSSCTDATGASVACPSR